MRHSLFYPSALGFIIGVFIRSIITVEISIILFLLTTSVSCIGYALFSKSHYSVPEIKKYSLLFITAIFMLWSSGGMMRYSYFVRNSGDQELLKRVDQTVTLSGIIISESDERETGTRFIVKINSLLDSGEVENSKYHHIEDTNIILLDQHYSSLLYGDEITFSGVLTQPENFETESGREFKYISYLAKDHIFFEIRNPEITEVTSHQGNVVKEYLFKLKNSYVEKINTYVPFPESTLAAGITIAGKKALPKDIEEEFKRTGTLQVVVLSGYNVTIVAQAFMAVCSFLPFIVSSSMGVLGIILFTIMAGGSATVVRGSIMAILILYAGLIRRRYNVIRALVAAALLMLFFNPMLLVYDPSFQLSFLATMGLITVSPIVEKHMSFVTERFGFRNMLASGVAAQIFVTPFLLYSSGDISIVAVPTNLLLSVLMPITMLVCFMTGMAGYVGMFLAVPLSYCAFIFLSLELLIVHIFSIIPFATVGNISFPLWLMCLVYMSFGVFIFKFHKKMKLM